MKIIVTVTEKVHHN